MKRLLLSVILTALASGWTSFAQVGAPSNPTPGMDAALIKLFGDIKAFSAKCETRVLDAQQQEKLSMTLDFALLDGKFRAEVDMTQIKGQEMGEGTVAAMKQMNMDRIISLTLPDKKAQYIIYPGLQAYLNQPLSQDEAAALEKEPKIEKTLLGKETLDGHACEKSKVVVTGGNGQKSEAIVWNATDLKNFPLQIQTQQKDQTAVLRYKGIQFTKPDAKLFELPAGYTGYDNMQAFSAGMMKKMMGGMGKP